MIENSKNTSCILALWAALLVPLIGLAQDDTTSGFAPTRVNDAKPRSPAPEGMVWIPGGEFSMGAAVNGEGSHEMPMASNDSGPIHRVRVDGFWMDATAVTNEQFEKFVRATGYVTIAERNAAGHGEVRYLDLMAANAKLHTLANDLLPA
jgi:formylglycine-generating enzyme required for sulfatase activity